MINTGIYTITNIITNKLYVGSTVDSFNIRWSKHLSTLRKNKHYNRHLQSAWNKYGESNFKFEILEECDIEYCLSQEQYWITILNVCNRNYGYNNSPIAGNCKGTKRTPEQNEANRNRSLGKKHSKDTIDKLKIIAKEKSLNGSLSYWKNKIKPKDIVLKSAKGRQRKVLQYSLDSVLLAEYESIKIAGEKTNSNPSLIYGVCSGKRSKHKNFIWKYEDNKE